MLAAFSSLQEILQQFQLSSSEITQNDTFSIFSSLPSSPSDSYQIQEIGIGHIHKTYLVTATTHASSPSNSSHCRPGPQFILQQINTQIFTRPILVMNNIQIIINHLAKKSIPTLTLIPLKSNNLRSITDTDGNGDNQQYYHVDSNGNYWRMYNYIENSRVVSDIPTIDEVYITSNAFGNFQYNLSDLSPESLSTTIPDFHNTKLRYQQFLQAVHDDPHHRILEYQLQPEINLIISRANKLINIIPSLHEDHHIPYRIVHNDTKLNNVLLNNETNEAICVIDLDTVMEGSLLCDFGDMVRSACNSTTEDEVNLQKIYCDLMKFEAIVKGYLSSNICKVNPITSNRILSDVERVHLVIAAQVITYEQTLRFLTDFLLGDVYYKVNCNRPQHNLERSRNQFQLFLSMEEHEKEMNDLVEMIWNEIK